MCIAYGEINPGIVHLGGAFEVSSTRIQIGMYVMMTQCTTADRL